MEQWDILAVNNWWVYYSNGYMDMIEYKIFIKKINWLTYLELFYDLLNKVF